MAPLYTCGLADRKTKSDTALWLGATTTRELSIKKKCMDMGMDMGMEMCMDM